MKTIYSKIPQIELFKWVTLILIVVLNSCSGDEEVPEPEPVTLQVIEGKHKGALFTEFGAQNISMIITDAGNDKYNVDFFESLNFEPAFTKDGQTPDGRGSIEVDGEVAKIDLVIGTSLSPCEGTLTGPGTRNNQGIFNFEAIIETDCGDNVRAEVEVTKSSD